MSKPQPAISLDKTLKWLDKTGTHKLITQRAAINFAKPYNTHADS